MCTSESIAAQETGESENECRKAPGWGTARERKEGGGCKTTRAGGEGAAPAVIKKVARRRTEQALCYLRCCPVQ